MRYLIKYKDGSVSIMTTVSDDITPESEISKWPPEHQEVIESYRPLEESEIPGDRYFRDAWVHDEDRLHVHTEKCRDIHRNVLRELRRPKLDALDLEFMKAVEEEDEAKKAAIALKKQLLRDLPAAHEIANAQTPEEIKAYMPNILL